MKPVGLATDLFDAVAASAAGAARAVRGDGASALLFWGDPAEVEVVRPQGVPDDVCRALAAAGGRHVAALVRRVARPIRIEAGQLPREADALSAALRAHDIAALAVFPLLGEFGPVGCVVVPLGIGDAPAAEREWLLGCSTLAALQIAAADASLRAILALERRRRVGLCDGVLVVDRFERVVFADGLVRELRGWDRADPFGRALASLPGGAGLSSLPLGRTEHGDWTRHHLEDEAGAVPVSVAALPGQLVDGAPDGSRVYLIRDLREPAVGRPDATGRILALALRVAHAADELLARVERDDVPPGPRAPMVLQARQALESVGAVLDRTVDEDTRDRVDLNDAVAQALERVADELRLERVRVFSFLRAELRPVAGDALGILKAMRTLVERARASLRQGGGTLTVRTWAEDGWVCAAVSDDGAGAVSSGPRGFEPLFPDVDAPEAGLDEIRALLKKHGGRLQVERRPHVWNRYTIMLPAERRLLPAGDDLPSETFVARNAAGKLTVLVVDDNAALRSVLKRFLERRGHTVTEAVDGDQALGIVGDVDFDRVIVDVHMPGKTGPEFYDSLEDVAPALRGRTLFMTGGSIEEATETFLRRSGRPAIKKPFDLIELAETVEGGRG